MDDTQRRRFDALMQENCGEKLIQDLYGISRSDDTSFFLRYLVWGQRLGVRPVDTSGRINRHMFETFLQRMKLVPVRLAGARSGMTEVAFRKTMEILAIQGITDAEFEATKCVVSEGFVRDLSNQFKALQFRTFGSHDDYCRRLQQALADEFKIEVEPLYCVTSQKLGENPADFAYEFDAITLDPIGLRYQVWLDTKKPMNLRPDVCSLWFYVREETALKQYLPFDEPPHQLDSKNEINLRESLMKAAG